MGNQVNIIFIDCLKLYKQHLYLQNYLKVKDTIGIIQKVIKTTFINIPKHTFMFFYRQKSADRFQRSADFHFISFSLHCSPHELIVNLHFLCLISILTYDLFLDDNPFDELIEYVGIQFLYIRILLDERNELFHILERFLGFLPLLFQRFLPAFQFSFLLIEPLIHILISFIADST